MQRLKRHGFRGALVLGASRLLVTLVLLAGVFIPGALDNQSAQLLIIGAVVGHWLGHGGDKDRVAHDGEPSSQHRTTNRQTTDTVKGGSE